MYAVLMPLCQAQYIRINLICKLTSQHENTGTQRRTASVITDGLWFEIVNTVALNRNDLRPLESKIPRDYNSRDLVEFLRKPFLQRSQTLAQEGSAAVHEDFHA